MRPPAPTRGRAKLSTPRGRARSHCSSSPMPRRHPPQASHQRDPRKAPPGPTSTARHIMNPPGGSHFGPRKRRLGSGRAAVVVRRPPGRVWHGFAVPAAGMDAWTNAAGRLAGFVGCIGMKRQAADQSTFFTERTLASYLAVSDRTIRNWIRRGELPSYKLGASRRIDPADVNAFLSQRREEA